MALDESSLSAEIVANFTAAGGAASPPNDVQKLADAIAKAVVDRIKADAQVQVTGVTPGVGTAVGTIT